MFVSEDLVAAGKFNAVNLIREIAKEIPAAAADSHSLPRREVKMPKVLIQQLLKQRKVCKQTAITVLRVLPYILYPGKRCGLGKFRI